MSSASFVSLKIFKDSRLLKIKIFTEDQISIGAGEGLTLQLEGIAPWHLLIEKKNNMFSALDLGSQTGAFLNGHLIREETPLPSGAFLKIGPYDIQFFIGPPVQSPAHAKPQPQAPSAPSPSSSVPSAPHVKSPAVVPSVPPAPSGPSSAQPVVSPVEEPAGAVPQMPSAPHVKSPAVVPSVPPAPSGPSSAQPVVPPVEEPAGAVPQMPSAPHVKSPAVVPSVPPAPSGPSSAQPVVPPVEEPAGAVPQMPSAPHVKSPAPAPSAVPAPSDPSSSQPVVPPVEEPAGVAPQMPSAPHVKSPAPAPSDSTSEPPSVPFVEEPSGLIPQALFAEEPASAPAEGPAPPEPISRPVKPKGKGFWNTYAPAGAIKNLDDYLQPSVGNLIEVIVCWKERILSAFHFSDKGNIFIGADKNCQIKIPNMLSKTPYRLMSISSGAKIYFKQGVKGFLFKGKDKRTRTSHEIQGDHAVSLKPYEMLRMDFGSALKLYVRLMDKPAKAPFAGLLNLKVPEALALLLAFLMTGVLIFYGTLYAPVFLADDVKFVEENVRVAQVVFQPQKKPAKVVEYDLGDKTKKADLSRKKPIKKKKRPVVKSIKRPKPKKRVVKKPPSTPRKGKEGAMAAQAPGKNPRKKKVTVGSVRPGGSLKTGKKGSSAKTVAPDPTKVGLLGAFGGGGKLAKLDKGASGSGGLLGLAEQSTGFAGTEEAYEGKGIGTKTKELGSGGKGQSLVGISGIKTKGKGLGRAGSGTGGLGKRGRMNIEFGTDDIDVAGEIDREAILRVLKRNQPKFQRCYQLSLNEKPGAQGNLGMQWLIAANGRGRGARAFKDPIGARSLRNCVAGILNGLNFPAPPAGQTPKVTFTFRFYL